MSTSRLAEPSKIAFAGDWHANGYWAKQMIEYARRQGADTVVQLGDFGFTFQHSFLRTVRHAAEEQDVTVFFVDGNHDNHNILWKAWTRTEDGFRQPPFGNFKHRLNYIPRGHRWEWWGLRFLGVGGAASVDKRWRTEGRDWWPTEMISEADIARAVKGGPVDVMVAHDLFDSAPFPNDRKDTGWPLEALGRAQANRMAVQRIVEAVAPRLFVHGHYHVRKDAMTRVNGQWVKVVTLDMDATTIHQNVWVVTREDLTADSTGRDSDPHSVG